MDRRSFISSGVGFGALAAGRLVTSKLTMALGQDSKAMQGATVETNLGKVRGTTQAGVQAYRGVPYAASTSGANRFMPPAKRDPWTGIRECAQLGLRSPQLNSDFHGQVPMAFDVMCPDEPMGEDCLVVNVWTPGTKGGKRPIMVWLHGGGFTSGSGGFICYSGQELARKHDVVVVTVNHRLTVFGYLYLAGIDGAKYEKSGNIGMLDIVSALEWVRDNASAFGADAGNVTIFGQSGGGAKVSALMAMPSAKGLFHKAIIESGADVKGVPVEVANKSAEMYLSRLNLKLDQIDQLQQLSIEQLLAAIPPGGGPGSPGLALAPVVDGSTLPSGPFDPAAPAMSADIPLLIGTTETEVTFFPNQILDPIDDGSLRTHVKQILPKASDAQVDEVIAAYRKGRSGVANTDLYLVLASDATFRAGVLTQADRKADQAKAVVYQYYFTWKSPVDGGRLRSFHTLEIPFAFDNVDVATSMTGTGPERQPLADKVSGAWVAFARSGNPSHKGLPNWSPFDTTKRATMILDNECKLVNDPHGTEQRLLRGIQNG